jgi:transposase
VAKPLGHGPEPRLGTAEREVLRQLVAADNDDATLAEYSARLAAQTGTHVSRPVLCVTLKRLGLTRKKRRSGRVSRRVPTSSPNAPPLPRRSRASHPRTWSFSTRLGSAPS